MKVDKIAKNLLLNNTCSNCLKSSECKSSSDNTCLNWESRIVYGKYIPITRKVVICTKKQKPIAQ